MLAEREKKKEREREEERNGETEIESERGERERNRERGEIETEEKKERETCGAYSRRTCHKQSFSLIKARLFSSPKHEEFKLTGSRGTWCTAGCT